MLHFNQTTKVIALYASMLLLILTSEVIASDTQKIDQDDTDITATLSWQDDNPDTTKSDFYDTYLRDRLEIGTRINYSILTDSESGDDDTFLGTIDGLDENQDYTPNNFFARYYFTKHFGIELAYDSIEAETIAPSDLQGTKTDGDVSLAGPTVSLIGRYPNSSKFTPYAFMGVGFYSGDFEEDENWASDEDTEVVRVMDVDDEVGFLMGIGCGYQFTDHLAADVSVQYTAVEADATFNRYQYGNWTLTRYGSFPLDNVALRAGLTFQF